MEDLLRKIRGAEGGQKCQLLAEVFAEVEKGFTQVEKEVESNNVKIDYADLHIKFDQIEEIIKEMKGLFLLEQIKQFFLKLKKRFERLHIEGEILSKELKGLTWEKVEKRLRANPEKLKSLLKMEETGGEPNVVKVDKKNW